MKRFGALGIHLGSLAERLTEVEQERDRLVQALQETDKALQKPLPPLFGEPLLGWKYSKIQGNIYRARQIIDRALIK